MNFDEVPLIKLIPVLCAIRDRDWQQLKKLERQFVEEFGKECWDKFSDLRVRHSLDDDSSKWMIAESFRESIAEGSFCQDFTESERFVEFLKSLSLKELHVIGEALSWRSTSGNRLSQEEVINSIVDELKHKIEENLWSAKQYQLRISRTNQDITNAIESLNKYL